MVLTGFDHSFHDLVYNVSTILTFFVLQNHMLCNANSFSKSQRFIENVCVGHFYHKWLLTDKYLCATDIGKSVISHTFTMVVKKLVDVVHLQCCKQKKYNVEVSLHN